MELPAAIDRLHHSAFPTPCHSLPQAVCKVSLLHCCRALDLDEFRNFLRRYSLLTDSPFFLYADDMVNFCP